MERLTEYDEFWNAEFVGIDNTKLYERLVCDETVALTIATNKLAELEDVMEKFDIENPTILDFYLQTIKNINMQNSNMRNELAELKAKMIVPKFKVGQEIYVIDDYFRVTSAIIERITICRENSISEGETSYVHYLANLGEKYEWDERYLILDDEDISSTKEEAEQKLAEIKGEKDE